MNKITEQWLSDSDFKWSQEERQPGKHWRIWLGWGASNSNARIDDIGIEITQAWWENWIGEDVGDIGGYHCWIISHGGSRKIIHVRHLYYQEEVIKLVEAITGNTWNPDNHAFGNVYSPEIVERMKKVGQWIEKGE